MHWWVGLGLGLCPGLPAQDARKIVEESQKRGTVNSQKYEGVLKVEDKSRTVSEKHWHYVRQGSYGASKAVLRFTAPPEVKGVALLIVNHPDRSADQWMWTPAIARERRIAFQDRSTRFFGTDFSFEDLEERDVNQYEYKMMGEDAVDEVKCWRIETRPRQGKSSQYTSAQIWIRQNDYVPARVESYIKDLLVRRLNYSDIEKEQGVWLARTLVMNDLRRGSRTTLRLERLQLNTAVSESEFTLQALRGEQ
jgi:outer membrane lipoprotein-sorting protein